MPNNLSILPEPLIEFRYGQSLLDPHDGLSLFGPYDVDAPSHPKNITYGVLGTEEGIESFAEWSQVINHPIPTKEGLNKQLWPSFPGFDAAFNSTWPEKPAWSHTIDREDLLNALRHLDPNKRTFDVAGKYLNGISIVKKRDEAFDVLVCVVPDEVWENCRPQSKVGDGWGYGPPKKVREQRAKGQRSLFDDWVSNKINSFREWTIEQYKLSVDFRRQIKARAMKYDIPIQIIRESTLRLGPPDEKNPRGLTPVSDRAWNLSTTLYYKAGGKPWKLSNAREGVCYIGIAFRKTDSGEKGRTACCAAQMFLDSGDGIVFLGDEGPWYSPHNNQYHLSREAAKNLLTGILETYEDLEGKALREIFLHSRSSISESEFEGYMEACPKGVKLIGVRVRLEPYGLRLFRKGSLPVMRGTFWRWSDTTGYLWGSGFKPRLGTYDGWEVPVPLRIDIQHGNASIEQISNDIFGLTKLNYNACKLGDSQPVTIGFSDAVGEILVSNPSIKHRSPRFKFYI